MFCHYLCIRFPESKVYYEFYAATNDDHLREFIQRELEAFFKRKDFEFSIYNTVRVSFLLRKNESY